MYSSRPRLVSIGRPSALAAVAAAAAPPASSAGLAGRPLERLEDRGLGDPVAALEVGASVWSEAIADSVWVRWSKTRTRSVSMKAAIGTPTGSCSGSGTVGSKTETAS